jgi:hypothetical protein
LTPPLDDRERERLELAIEELLEGRALIMSNPRFTSRQRLHEARELRRRIARRHNISQPYFDLAVAARIP